MIARELLQESAVGNDVESEIYVESLRKRSFVWADGRPQAHTMAEENGLCLRVLKDNRQGVAVSKNTSAETVSRLTHAALDVASLTPKDPDRVLFSGSASYPESIPFDDTVFTASSESILDQLAQIEKAILKTDKRIKKVIKLAYSEETSATALANTLGLSKESTGSSVGVVVEVLAEAGGHTEVGWDFRSHRFKKLLNMESLATAVARSTAQSLGGSAVPSGLYTVLVHPRVGCQLLDLFSDALSAEAVHLGQSFLRGALDTLVASSKVSLVDDSLLSDGLASREFDDEGVPRESLVMVADGVLKDYFFDLRSAKRSRRTSNACAVKSSLGAVAKPGPSNFYLKPGSILLQELTAGAETIFYLQDVMGLHMADPITGEFSLGASGALYKNGQFVKPVRGVTIAGSVGTFFKNVTALGNDLTWYGSIGAPHFLVDRVSVAGTN